MADQERILTVWQIRIRVMSNGDGEQSIEYTRYVQSNQWIGSKGYKTDLVLLYWYISEEFQLKKPFPCSVFGNSQRAVFYNISSVWGHSLIIPRLEKSRLSVPYVIMWKHAIEARIQN